MFLLNPLGPLVILHTKGDWGAGRMPYAIAKSSSRPQGGFLGTSNDEWNQLAMVGGFGAEYARVFDGTRDSLLDVEKAPQYLIVEKSRSELPDMFWGVGFLLVISEPYRDIIERLDPGIHQMWPIELRRKRKEPYPGRWYGLNIRPRAKTIQEDGSETWVAKGSKRLGTSDRVWVDLSFKVAVKSDALPSVNLWWDDGLDEPIILCSDALRDAVVEAGLRSIPLIKAKEV